MKAWSKVIKAAAILVGAAVLFAAGYVIYAIAVYHRVEDYQQLEVQDNISGQNAQTEQVYSLMSWNVGFGAYSDDYSFFMDGGKYSRAFSKEAVNENIQGDISVIEEYKPDFLFLQEVDKNSTRSYHVDESLMFSEVMPDRASVFAVNYDSPYLLYPITEPHGKSYSGLMTFSDCPIEDSIRRSLPIEGGFMKFIDLDRCYMMTRIPLENGKYLCLYNLHLSAYTSDGTIADEQLKVLAADMKEQYDQGNYIISGGDFNKDLLGNSGERFGVEGEEYNWAQPLKMELLAPVFRLLGIYDEDHPVASCRNADSPYEEGVSYRVTVDGFLVSDNIEVLTSEVVDTGFKYSDHNPVYITFRLLP